MNLLNQPITIKNIGLNNRIVMPPMATSQSEDGQVTQKLVDYYAEKSEGGYIGLIITEHSYVSKEGQATKGQISIATDDDIKGLKRIVEVIHQNGSKVIAQMNHAGSSAVPEVTGHNIMSASPIANPGSTAKTGIIPHEMTRTDIKRVITCFADAARRAKEAGFDGVESIQLMPIYLISFFHHSRISAQMNTGDL